MEVDGPVDPLAREATVKPRIGIITLASDDLERSIRFYRDGLGLPTDGIAAPEHGGSHVAFHMEGGIELVLFERSALAELMRGVGGAGGANEVILSLQAESRIDVDEMLSRVEAYGGSRAGDTEGAEWGYHGHFRDPDGHLWEVVWFGNGE